MKLDLADTNKRQNTKLHKISKFDGELSSPTNTRSLVKNIDSGLWDWLVGIS